MGGGPALFGIGSCGILCPPKNQIGKVHPAVRRTVVCRVVRDAGGATS